MNCQWSRVVGARLFRAMDPLIVTLGEPVHDLS